MICCDDAPKVYSIIVEGTNGLNSPFDFERSLFRIPLAANGNETAPQLRGSFMPTSYDWRSSGNPVVTTSPYKAILASAVAGPSSIPSEETASRPPPFGDPDPIEGFPSELFAELFDRQIDPI